MVQDDQGPRRQRPDQAHLLERELRFQLPFSELDPDYSERLDQHLDRVSAALGGVEGIWDSTQEVLGEVFSRGDGKLNPAWSGS